MKGNTVKKRKQFDLKLYGICRLLGKSPLSYTRKQNPSVQGNNKTHIDLGYRSTMGKINNRKSEIEVQTQSS